jgi:hypothetical protein
MPLRTRPPSTSATGRPRRLPWASSRARFYCTAGKGVTPNRAVDPLHGSIQIGGRLADQQGRKPGIEVDFDALRTSPGVSQATNRSGLANTHDTVAAVHPQYQERLAVHRMHRQLVRADRRKVDDLGIETFDNGGGHAIRPVILLLSSD